MAANLLDNMTPADVQRALQDRFQAAVTASRGGDILSDEQIDYESLRPIISDLWGFRDPTSDLMNSDPARILGTLTRNMVRALRGEITPLELNARIADKIARHNRNANTIIGSREMTGIEAPIFVAPIDQGNFLGMTSDLLTRLGERAVGRQAMATGTGLIGYIEGFRRWEETARNPIIKKGLQSVITSLDFLVNRFGRKGAAVAAGAGVLLSAKAMSKATNHLQASLINLWDYISNVKGFEKINNNQTHTNSTSGSWTKPGQAETAGRLGDNANAGQNIAGHTEQLAQLIQSLVNKINGAEVKPNDMEALKMTVSLLEKNINDSRLKLLFSQEYENNLLSVLRRKIGTQLLMMNNPSAFSRSAIQGRSTRYATETWTPIGYPLPPY